MGAPGGPASASKGLAIAALVCGIIALLAAITVFGGFFFGLVAIVLGIVAVVKARKGTAGGFGLGVGGIVCGALGLLIAIALTAMGVAVVGDAINNPEKYGMSQSDIADIQNALNGDSGANNSSGTSSKDGFAQSSGSSSSSSSTPQAGSASKVPAPYSDGKGSLTVAAALDEDGATIASQLDALGLSFDGTYEGWRNQEFTICFDVMDENSDWITPDTLKTLGAGEASGYMITSDFYETAVQAWEALNQTEVVKSNIEQNQDSTESSYALVKSKSGKSAIVTLSSMDRTVVLMVYPDTQREFGIDAETLYNQLTS